MGGIGDDFGRDVNGVIARVGQGQVGGVPIAHLKSIEERGVVGPTDKVIVNADGETKDEAEREEGVTGTRAAASQRLVERECPDCAQPGEGGEGAGHTGEVGRIEVERKDDRHEHEACPQNEDGRRI